MLSFSYLPEHFPECLDTPILHPFPSKSAICSRFPNTYLNLNVVLSFFFFCDLNLFCDARGPCFKKCFTGKKGRHQTFVSLLFNYGQIPIDRLRRRRTCGRSLAEFNEWPSPTVCIHFQGRLPQPFHATEGAAPATVHGREVWCSRGGIRSQDAGRERGSHECQGRETRGSRGTPPHDTGAACCKQPGSPQPTPGRRDR